MADATMMQPSLPDDVVFEILSWAPVKSVCRFRCVSRGWHTLTSGPAFIAAHRARAEPLLLFTADSSHKAGSELRLLDMDGNLVTTIKQRAGLSPLDYRLDGTVCLTNDYCVTLTGRSRFIVKVIDLATGNVVWRTSREAEMLTGRTTFIELDYEPFWGLNVRCAAPSGMYKLVYLNSTYDEKLCKVLTLEDDAKWRQVHAPSEQVTNNNSIDPAIMVNGVMHFLYKSHMDKDRHRVLRFDLESEQWRSSINAPMRSGDKPEEKTQITCMVKLNDAICIVERSLINIWLIWLLTDPEKGTWVKAYSIPMASLAHSVMPLTVMRDARRLLFYVYDTYATATSTLQVYDPLTGKCTHHLKFANKLLDHAIPCEFHLESFVSPKISLMATPSVLSRLNQ